MALLDVRDLSVKFSRRGVSVQALDRVSFRVEPGEVLGIVGESGAGKSLTGSAVMGLIDPPGQITGGEVILEGRRIDGLSGEALRQVRGRRIGAIFQDPLTALDPLYTVGRQLIETMRTHLPLTHGEARERAARWLEQVGINGASARLDSYPHEFSGGMRQRVVIALALCAEPSLVIADEPTTALDVSIQAQVIAVLKRLTRDKGTAVILVTHDMGVIAETAQRVAVMYAGRIVEIGPVRDVVLRPRHPYTRGLMASIPDMRQPRGRLSQIGGSMPRLDAMPSGCAFHPRCPHAVERCVTERPEMEPGVHSAACLLSEETAQARPEWKERTIV